MRLTHSVHARSLGRSGAQLNSEINTFQRYFVNEVRRCEEMERKLRTCVCLKGRVHTRLKGRVHMRLKGRAAGFGCMC